MAGYIRDYRQELDSKIWTMPPLYHRVWQYLKYRACYRETELKLKDGSMLKVGPGQYFTSVREIARDVAWNERSKPQVPNPKLIDTVLKWLQAEQMITIQGVMGDFQGNGLGNAKSNSQSNSLGTLVTLVNWAFFQDLKNESNTQSNAESNGLGNEKNNKDLKNKDLSVLPSKNVREEIELTRLGDGVPSTDPQGEISLFKQIEDRYIQRRAYGLDLSGDDIAAIQEILNDDIPVETILAGIDDAFQHHKPRFRGDRIKSFKYCDPVIREKHFRNQMREERQPNAQIDRGHAGPGRHPPASGRNSGGSAERSSYYDQFDGLIQNL